MRPLIVPTSDVNSDTAIVAVWHVTDRSHVSAGVIVAEVETSKSVLEVVAPESGYLLRCAEEGEEIVLASPLAYLFTTSDALDEHAAHLAEAAAAACASSNGGRATAPAIRRAAELGVDLASLPGRELVTVRMVEAAAVGEASAPPPELPLPLDAPSGVERVAVIGAGLGATQVIDIFATDPSKTAVAIVDDDRSRWAGRVAGVPIVGDTQQLEELFARDRLDSAVIAVGTSTPARKRLRELCGALGIPLTNAIDRTARICTDVELGTGNVICAHCHFGVGTRIGDNNMLSAYNSFDHHNVLGSDIATGPGCMTSGLVRIGDGVRLGTGIFIEPHLEIGHGAQVASGAVIVTSVPPAHAVKRRVPTMTTVPLRLPAHVANGPG
jgi:acetyltransferase-like isoleucine patch superfamily enzyme